MNPVERVVRAADQLQQHVKPAAFASGVVKKFGDDRGALLAVVMAYYSFLALFPSLLVATTILGFIGNQRLEGTVVGATLQQFPVYGEQLGAHPVHPLTGSPLALALGLAGLVYGALGVAQASQHAMAEVWNVPGVRRPGFPVRLARGLVLFVVFGAMVAATAALSGLATVEGHSWPFRLLLLAAELPLNSLVFLLAYRVLTPKSVPARQLVVGAVVGGVGYTVLLGVGTALVQHQLRHTEPLYGQYAFVLGLMAWLFLVAQVTLYAAEVNVVLARRLWPRSIVQPPLTAADKRVLHDIAQQEERRPEERVGVGFDPEPADEAFNDARRHRQ